jgi:hypothetical protein
MDRNLLSASMDGQLTEVDIVTKARLSDKPMRLTLHPQDKERLLSEGAKPGKIIRLDSNNLEITTMNKETFTSKFIELLETQKNRTNLALQDLRAFNDRFLGSTPEDVGKSPAEPEPVGYHAKILQTVDETNQRLSELEHELDRMKRIG